MNFFSNSITFSENEDEEIDGESPSAQSGQSSNANATVSDKRARAKSAAKQTKEFLDKKGQQEIKLRENEHEIRMEVMGHSNNM